MNARRITGRGIVDGDAEGLALMSPALSFLGDIDIRTGNIVGDVGSVKGQSVKGRILVMPYSRGSAGAWRFLYQLSKLDTQPVAIVTDDLPDPSLVQGAILAKVPMVCALEHRTSDFFEDGARYRLTSKDGAALIERVT